MADPQSTGDTKEEKAVAVLVFHGMGQQVPFETIEALASNLERCGGTGCPGVARLTGVRHACFGDREYPRAEMLVRECDDKPDNGVPVHVYESYWAPLAAGQITLRETMAFFFRSTWLGLLNSGRKFSRVMFGDNREFPREARTARSFILLLVLFFASMVLNVAAIAVAAKALLPAAAGSWMGASFMRGLVTLLTACGLALVPFGLFLYLAKHLRNQAKGCRRPGPTHKWLAHSIRWSGAALALTVILAAGLLLVFVVGRVAPPWTFPWAWLHTKWATLLLVVGAASAAYAARWAVLNYLGDVALYLSSGFVSRFHGARRAIKDAAYRVARDILSSTEEDGTYTYERVIIVAHSLGSLIAYDTLNKLLRKDNCAKGTPACLGVADRVPLFLTFGSPLDKTAFIYWNYRTTDSAIREKLATTKQPLIMDYAYRPNCWVNIHSPADVVSGALDYYDLDPANPKICRRRAICNLVDKDATTPLVAHNEYWENDLLANTILKSILRIPCKIRGAAAAAPSSTSGPPTT